MEAMKVLTSLLVLTLTGPTLGYPYTRGMPSRTSGRGREQMLEGGLGEYLGGYMQDQQYALPEYQPTYRHGYAAQRPRINAEALAALLPYLTGANDDYAYDYNTYSDDEGTWYDDTANADIAEPVESDDAALFQYLINHRNGRYSLEDLENLEREAEMEDNTENQLHALLAKKISKKANMPVLGSRQVGAAPLPAVSLRGQKEEALDIPATSIRRPVFARQITTQPEEQTASESAQVSNDKRSVVSTAKPEEEKTVSSTPVSAVTDKADESTTMSPYMLNRYDAFLKYLDRERKVRQQQDFEQELQQEMRPPQKRFITDQEALTQQLASLKKSVA
ncbi:uncharacterized protein [Penaeus vannamei]|nr:uncharacterized protein LOC113828763 [Penaeus vannamei]